MHKLVKDFFVDSGEKERVVGWSSKEGQIIANGPFYVLNAKLKLRFKKMQSAVLFLVEVILYWKDKRGLFCHDNTWEWQGEGNDAKRVDLPEDEWTFSYKTPSDCGGCVSGQKILDKIFGDRYRFNELPCVTSNGREYSFRFDLLKHFAQQGHQSTLQLIEQRKQDEAKKKAEAKAEQEKRLLNEQEAKLTEKLGDKIINLEVRKQLSPYVEKNMYVVSQDVAAVITNRSEWGGGSGIGYFDQVRVFYKSQAQMQEFQWRDRWSESKDKPWLKVNELGKIDIIEKGDEVFVEVELINSRYSNRTTTFTFKKE